MKSDIYLPIVPTYIRTKVFLGEIFVRRLWLTSCHNHKKTAYYFEITQYICPARFSSRWLQPQSQCGVNCSQTLREVPHQKNILASFRMPIPLPMANISIIILHEHFSNTCSCSSTILSRLIKSEVPYFGCYEFNFKTTPPGK